MNTTFNLIIQKLLPYFYVILFAYLLSSIAFSYLPKEDINFISDDSKTLEYRKFSGFYSNIQNSENEIQSESKVLLKAQNLSKYALKAIYSTTENGGWITIEDPKENKSYILSQWDEMDGYILTKLFKNYVIFEKAAKEYKLEIKKTEDENVSYEMSRNDSDSSIKENIIVKDDVVQVNRNYLNSYVNDIDKVWNNIAIKEIKNQDKIDGFKVFRVAKDSVFDKLGLKEGDVIKSINNNVLGSYADAFKVYNEINNTKYLNIEILRNNEVMELNYEID